MKLRCAAKRKAVRQLRDPPAEGGDQLRGRAQPVGLLQPQTRGVFNVRLALGQRRDERAAEAAKFAKQQEAEGIALVGKAEAEAIRQKGLAEAEAMKQKAEAYKQYNDAAVAEMMIKVLPEIARSVAQPLSSIDKVSIIGGDASGVSGVSGNVPVLMAQTMEAMKEATGIDMRDIVRANSIEAKTDRNITIKTEAEE